jgi:putative ATP-dependent endonuclease of OLD family
MKMTKIEIRNYRSLCDVAIYPKDILALVGRNNSGKSNVLKALELFFEGSTALINEECFYGHIKEKAIEVFITFEQLSGWEKEQFAPWMNGDKLTIGRIIKCDGPDSYSAKNFAVTRVPQLEWLQEDVICGEKINEWWPKKANLKTNGLDFGATLGTSKPSVGEWKEHAKAFLKEHESSLEWKEERRENPKGYPGVLKGALPEFIFIRAVRDVSSEAKVVQTNPFGQLIRSMFEKVSGVEKDALTKQLKEIEKRLNRVGAKDRIAEIEQLEARLNKLMSEIMECDVELEIGMPQLQEIIGAVKIYANDGIRTTIETKGHGMQRSMIFTILRAYAELVHAQKAGEKAGERTTIFAIEEPELYMHPQSERTLMSVIREIAKGRNQIVYTTQSSLFVDIGHFDEICIMRREKTGGNYVSYPSQLFMSAMIEDLKARTGIDATEEGMREQYSHAFNPMINEGFFADKVVIVEGPSEQYALPIYADCLEYDMNRKNISVVHSDGKGQMDRLLRVFNGFKIPTYLWFDGDKKSEDKKVTDKTLELLELLGEPVDKIENVKTHVSDRYAVLESTLEELLSQELGDYESLCRQAKDTLGPSGKPLKHRFVAEQLRKRVIEGKSAGDVLPKTIIDIVEKIKTATYSCCILKKL